jgi:putative ABC transport system permease protein
MEPWIQDLRYGVRALAKNPGFAATALLTLALGIGADTSMFTVVNAVVLRSLPYRDASRLAVVWVDFGDSGQSLPTVSSLDFRDFPRMTTKFEGFAAGARTTANLTGGGDPEQVDLGRVTHDFFTLLGVEPILGRRFVAAEDVVNGPRVVLLSHRLWQRRFGGDPSIVGRAIQIDGTAHEVVGVMPPGFRLLLPSEAFLADSEIWAPLQDPYQGPRNRTLLTAIARLRDGVSFEQGQQEMDSVAARLREEYPVHEQSQTHIRLVPLQQDVIKDVRPALLALFGAVGLVLLIACANVANLFLTRAAARQREIAIRVSLGADRARIVRQMLTESVVLSFLAGSLGLLLALWATDVLVSMQPPHTTRLEGVVLDGSAFLFTASACVVTVLLCGLLPAIQASRPRLSVSLGRRATERSGASRRVLVAAEVVLSVVLLIGLGLLARSFLLLQDVRPGYDPDGVLAFRLSLPSARYPSPLSRIQFQDRLRERLEALPGVRSVGAVSQMPLTGSGSQGPYAYDEETARNWESVTADVRSATEDYFATAGIRWKAGRLFQPGDAADGPLVVIVDETLARKAWPGQDAVGKRLMLPLIAADGVHREWFEVVGVVEHARIHDLAQEGREQVYFPFRQRPSRRLDVWVRSDVDPATVTTLAATTVHDIDPDLPVHDPLPFSVYVLRSLAQLRFTVLVAASFGAVALFLATVALYGLVSYNVRQRAHELGIRRVLGARNAGILRLVMAEGLALSLAGTAIGAPLAWVATRALSSLLFGVSAADPWTYLAVPMVVTGVSLLACYLPARRATRTDPLLALRYE